MKQQSQKQLQQSVRSSSEVVQLRKDVLRLTADMPSRSSNPLVLTCPGLSLAALWVKMFGQAGSFNFSSGDRKFPMQKMLPLKFTPKMGSYNNTRFGIL